MNQVFGLSSAEAGFGSAKDGSENMSFLPIRRMEGEIRKKLIGAGDYRFANRLIR